MGVDTGLECKQLAREIADYNHEKWKCEDGIASKFMQNTQLQKHLKETGDKTIVECCRDTLWGTGVPIQDEKCLDDTLWYNQGIMGEILENIRSKQPNLRPMGPEADEQMETQPSTTDRMEAVGDTN